MAEYAICAEVYIRTDIPRKNVVWGNAIGWSISKRPPPTLRRWCMGGGRILAETSGAALRVDLLSPLRAVGISQLKNIVRIAAREWTVTTMPKRINPRRRPATQADVQRAKDAATADACRVTLAIFFTALLDKEGMDAEQLQRIWHEVEALSESVRDGYVSATDLIRVLREEYEINIVGG